MLSFGSLRHNTPRTHLHKYISSQYRPSNHPSKLRQATCHLLKSPCPYHPDCRITNFCSSYQCLLPLCPKCVKSHTQEHAQVGIHGEFETIEESLERADQTLVDFIRRAEGISHRATALHEAGRFRVEEVRREFMLVREKAICEFVAVFQRYEEDLEAMIRQEQSKLTKDLNKVADSVNYLIETSKKSLEMLYTPNSLDNLISFYSTTLMRSQDTIKMCDLTLSQGLTNKIVIHHFPDKLGSLVSTLRQYLALAIIQQPMPELPKVLREQTVYSPMARRMVALGKQNRSDITQQPGNSSGGSEPNTTFKFQ